MLNLTDREWKAYKVKQLFQIEKCKCSNVSKLGLGTVPYVGATNKNNGVMSFVKYNSKLITKGNCIAFICDGQGSVGYSIYKNEDFIGSTTVKVGRNKHLNRYIAMFLVSALDKNRMLYSYGYKRNENRLLNETILLPSATDGTPDYAFMEQYIKEREKRLIEKYKTFVSNNYQIGRVLPELNSREWKAFTLSDIFTYIRGNQNKMNTLTDGSFPLISAKNINNGLKSFVSENGKEAYKGNSISLNNDGDGGVGIAYYQPYKYVLDSHCTALFPKDTDSYHIMLFLCSAITKQRSLFSHGRSINESRLNNLTIMLPIKADGTPDYAFMEQYIKEREERLIEKYKTFISKNLQMCSDSRA